VTSVAADTDVLDGCRVVDVPIVDDHRPAGPHQPVEVGHARLLVGRDGHEHADADRRRAGALISPPT
jgi:hypothetical protein